MLANFCQRKDVEALNLMSTTQPLQLFEYVKNQLFFSNFLALGQKRIDEIKVGLPNFKEDVEVLLNYLRIFNNKFGATFNLHLPHIFIQNYFDEPQYQPSFEQIKEFKIIADSFLKGNSSLLHKHIALILTDGVDQKLSATNPEILELSFIKNHIQQIVNIAQEYLGFFEEHKKSLIEAEATNDQEHLQKINKITSFKKQIDKEELTKIFQHSLSQLASNQRPAEEFSKEKLQEIKEKFSRFFKDELRIDVVKIETEKIVRIATDQQIRIINARPLPMEVISSFSVINLNANKNIARNTALG